MARWLLLRWSSDAASEIHPLGEEKTLMRPQAKFLGRAAATLFLGALVALTLPGSAEAHGRRFAGFRPPRFYGFGFYPAFYASPYFYGFAPGPYGYLGAPAGGLDLNFARLMGWGALDLNVKPGKAEVWVDGQFVGKAGDFDGYPSYLWLAKGPHEVVVYEGGYETFRERYEVAPGSVFEVHLKMKKGNATPAAPAEMAPPKGAI
jgi:hypothetical protein